MGFHVQIEEQFLTWYIPCLSLLPYGTIEKYSAKNRKKQYVSSSKGEVYLHLFGVNFSWIFMFPNIWFFSWVFLFKPSFRWHQIFFCKCWKKKLKCDSKNFFLSLSSKFVKVLFSPFLIKKSNIWLQFWKRIVLSV